jgi:CRP/FNR family transcriptional regulator, cyclic AMP receptor protein
MEPNRAALRPLAPLEDPLEYLPRSQVAEYNKGQVIYNQNAPSTNIYLILEGRVKVSCLADRGRQVLVAIYQTEEFFGESAFLHPAQRPERAIALESTKLMSWTGSEVEAMVMRQPRLGVAFAQMMAQRTTEFTERIESFGADNLSRRLVRCLISLSARMGTRQEDGSVKMIPVTHELLAENIGTSREIVSHYMNQFRKQGYLQYSRKGIVLYPDAFDAWLRDASRQAANVPAPGEPTQPPPAERHSLKE